MNRPVEFEVLFWYQVGAHSLWEVRSAVAMAIKRSLTEAGIEIPYPHRVLTMAPEFADRRV